MSLEQFLQKIKSFNQIKKTKGKKDSGYLNISRLGDLLIFANLLILIISVHFYIKFEDFIQNSNNINSIEFKSENIISFESFQKKPENDEINSQDLVFASKNGTKYYFKNCSGLSRIKQENLISFDSEKEAIESGFEKAKTCK